MKITLKRRYLGPEYTIGSWFFDGIYLCDIIEDKVRDINQDGDLDDPGEGKVFGETAIPYGIYKIELSMSPKFKRVLPMILNVKHFTGIRIHRGRTAKHSHGCLLPGENKAKGQVLNSEKYEIEIIKQMMEATNRGEKMSIEII